ncbi:MAG: hypothetical protein IM620_21170, partial [Cytophagales bacterium]|nr:hypothetical protein [Cytophagales bacterium]
MYGKIRTIVLTGSGSWTVPADWNNDLNVIHAIGGGAARSVTGGNSGGGGAYSRYVGLNLSPGQSVFYSALATVNSAGSLGNDAWLNKVSNAAPSNNTQGILAKGGGTVSTSVAAGLASGCIGDGRAFDGGTGVVSGGGGGGGGGGAAGPHGPGGNGGAGNIFGAES